MYMTKIAVQYTVKQQLQHKTATWGFTTACTARVRIIRCSDGSAYRHYRNISATPILLRVSGSNSYVVVLVYM